VGRPAADIEQVRIATRRVLADLDSLTDEQAGAPSALRGWSRAELVTHLARNADGQRNMAEHAARGEVGYMYPGGVEQRSREIEAGRGARAAFVRADLRRAHDALMEAWANLPDDAWDRIGRAARAFPICEHVFRRWLEVEIHHVDLDLGYAATDWPVPFVTRALATTIEQLPSRPAPDRPAVDASVRIEATDHGRAWDVTLRGADVRVGPAIDGAAVDATVSGWGCDLLSWLYGRRPAAETVTVSGPEPRLARLPAWFPTG
jgi:maleylpyruvate isomerase